MGRQCASEGREGGEVQGCSAVNACHATPGPATAAHPAPARGSPSLQARQQPEEKEGREGLDLRRRRRGRLEHCLAATTLLSTIC